jgi:hypothetical protein
MGVALVFGLYYLWNGVSDYLASGGLGVVEATERAVIVDTATAERVEAARLEFTPLPTATPLPECQDFVSIAEMNVNIRQAPSRSAPVLGVLAPGETVCVITQEAEWRLIDRNPLTRRIEEAYVFANTLQAVNPTPTPSDTVTPAPTVTPLPTDTPSITPSPAPTNTPDSEATSTPTPSRTPSPTLMIRSA